MLNLILLQAAEAGAKQGGGWSFWIMMILILVVFYLFMILPQRKKQKELEKKRNEMKPGQKVVTAGGVYGILRKVEDTCFMVEIAKDVVIKIDKASVYATAEDAAAAPKEPEQKK